MKVIDALLHSRIWFVVSKYDGVTLYLDREMALDNLRRTDKLYSCKITDLKEEQDDTY